MSFLPTDYEAPAGNNRYMKFKDGDNRFRVLDSAIVGNELWINKKPVRKRMTDPFTRDQLESADTDREGNPSRAKHFWAFPVIDSSDSTVKILEITQRSVQDALRVIVQDPDWGSPTGYDLLVKREGSGIETSYSVNPKPAKPLSDAQKATWDAVVEKGFDLDELFISGDPFTPHLKTSVEEINIDDIPFI